MRNYSLRIGLILAAVCVSSTGVTSGVKRFMSGMSFFVVDFDYKPFGEDREKQEEQEVAVAPKGESEKTRWRNSDLIIGNSCIQPSTYH